MSEVKIDLVAIQEIKDIFKNGDGEGLPRIIEIFCVDNAARVKRMERSLAEKNFYLVGRDAHALRSSSGLLGADELAKLCLELESLDRRNKTELTSDQLIDELRRCFAETCAALRALDLRSAA